MAGFTESMINEKVQLFWAALQRGEFITDAAAEVGEVLAAETTRIPRLRLCHRPSPSVHFRRKQGKLAPTVVGLCCQRPSVNGTTPATAMLRVALRS